MRTASTECVQGIRSTLGFIRHYCFLWDEKAAWAAQLVAQAVYWLQLSLSVDSCESETRFGVRSGAVRLVVSFTCALDTDC